MNLACAEFVAIKEQSRSPVTGLRLCKITVYPAGCVATQSKMALAATVGCKFLSANEKPSLDDVPVAGVLW